MERLTSCSALCPELGQREVTRFFSVIVRELENAGTVHGTFNLPSPRRLLTLWIVVGFEPSDFAAGCFAAAIKS